MLFSVKICRIMRLLLLFGLVVARATSADNVPQCDRSKSDARHHYDPLACWLWYLQVAIPNQSFRESFITVSLNDMTCTNFTMASINSTYLPSNTTATNPAISVQVSGISATCIGQYHATGGIGGSVQAWVQQSANQPRSLGMSLEFVSTFHEGIKMASSVNATACDASLQVSSLHFGGSISARLINLFKGSIQQYVSDALSTSLCPSLQPELTKDLTQVIQQANRDIVPLLPNTTDSSDATLLRSDSLANDTLAYLWRDRLLASNDTNNNSSSGSGSVDWKVDTPVLYKGLTWLNMFLDRYLNVGFFVDAMQQVGWSVSPIFNCGYFFRGINGLIHSLSDNGQISFQVPGQVQNVSFVVPGYGQVRLNIHHVKLGGIDRWKGIDLLRPSKSNELSFYSSLSTNDDLNITVSINVEVRFLEDGAFRGDALQEAIEVSFSSSSASASALVALEYDKDLFYNIHLQDIISTIQNYKNMSQWSCLLAPIQSFLIDDVQLDAHVSTIVVKPIGSTGTLEKDIDAMLNTFVRLYLTEYDAMVHAVLAGLVQGPAQKALNEIVASWIQQQQESSSQNCAVIPDKDAAPEFVDFQGFGILKQLNSFLSRSLGTINGYLTCVEDVFDKSVRPMSFQVENIRVNVTKLSIQNPGCFNRLKVLSPTNKSKFQLENAFEYGTCNDSVGSPGLFATFNVSSPLFDFDGNFNVSAWMGNVTTVAGGSSLKYDLTEFRRLSVSTLLSDGLCAAMPLVDLRLLEPTETMGNPGMDLSSLLSSSVFNSKNIWFSTESHETIPAAVESMLSWGLSSVEEVVNGIAKDALPGEICNCAGRNATPSAETEGQGDDMDAVLISGAIAAAAFVMVNVLLLCIRLCKCSSPNAESELAQPLLRTDPYLEMEPSDENLEGGGVESRTRGILYTDTSVPSFVRHAFPVAVVGTILLLLASNLSVGASVDLVIASDKGKTVFSPTLFAFSLGNTAREMYNAGIYSLLFLVVGFSGIWPYAKLLLMLFGWCSHTSLLDTRQRGRMVFLLDSLGKFSLVDTFVLVLMMVSFRFHLVLEGLMTVDVFVNPGFGFYSFLLATMMSLIAGHLILYFHRRSLVPHTLSSGDENNVTESLCRHEFQDVKHGTQRRMSKLFSGTIVAVLIVAAVFLGIGMTKQSFIFKVGGLAGKLLDDDDRVKTYSLLTLGTSLPSSVQTPSFGTTCSQTAYFFYAAIMPFACLVVLSILWLIPMTLTWQKRFITVAEIANAWSAVEVFALSIIVSLIELPTFASFMLGDKCDFINEFLATHFDDELDGDHVCYTVSSSVAPNVWFLVCGAVLNSIIVSFLLKVAHVAIRERTERQYELETKDILSNEGVEASHRNVVSILLRSKWVGDILFLASMDEDGKMDENGDTDVVEGERDVTTGDKHDVEGEHERQKSQGSKEFWQEWRQVCSVT